MGAGASRDADVLALLAQYWTDVLAHLDDGSRDRLTELLALPQETVDPGAQAEIEDLLLDHLPPSHPVAEALGQGDRLMLHPGSTVDSLSLADFRRMVSLGSPPLSEVLDPEPSDSAPWATEPLESDPPEPPDPGGLPSWRELHRQVRRRLLRVPQVDANDIDGLDRSDPRLLWLQDDEGRAVLPAFQLDPDGRPWLALLEVNALLDAGLDPWGVTSWWVDPHAGLGVPPQRLLGTGHDAVLVRMARSVGED